MIPGSLLKDIKKTLREKHDCGTQDQIVKAMLRPHDFKDGKMWLLLKLVYTNPPRDLVKRRPNRMDAASLKVIHAHICGVEALRNMPRRDNQGEKRDHSRNVGDKWDFLLRRGRMGQTSAQKHKSGQQQCRVYNDSSGVYNPGFFVSNAQYHHGCENDDIERANFKS